MKPVLILGATSDIARAIARLYAEKGRSIILAGRSPDRLAADIADLKIRTGAAAQAVEFDILDTSRHGAFLDSLEELPETVICVVGFMGDQAVSERDMGAAELVMRSNYVGPCAILAEAANRMQLRGHGTLVGISSVAGERGRAKNYVYGSAKAGFTGFLSGLRHRLAQAQSRVKVITVVPGFVRTSAVAGMETSPLLTAAPKEVASAILKAEITGKDVIYVRPIWRLVMAVIRALPQPIFNKLKI